MTTDKKFFGHPLGLSTLFATEFWERFSYYGMRALLVLYLTATLVDGGFGMSEAEALIIYGIFTSLVYVTPIAGGLLADKVLGQRKAIYIGAITMAMGQFALAYSSFASNASDDFRLEVFYFGLATLIIGNGFFKPNISTMVGDLYDPKDETGRDSGFTIFYMGINAGAFLAPWIAGYLGEQVDWYWGFFAAGIGMLVGTVWFGMMSPTIGKVGLPPKAADNPDYGLRINKKDWFSVGIWVIGSILVVIAVLFLLNVVPTDIMDTILMWTLIIGLVGMLYIIAKNTSGKTEWKHVIAIFVLALLNIVFWSGFEQAGGTFNFFARDMTQRKFGNFEVATSAFQSINAIAIFIFAPLFTILWKWLSDKKINPRTPNKFAFGLLFLSIGFFVMAIADGQANKMLADNPDMASSAAIGISPLWLVVVYLLHTWGELFISPIGLSMITKLSPPKIVSLMMGLWMGSIAVGNYLAAAMHSIVENIEASRGIEINLFQFIGIEVLIAAVIAFAIAPLLNKLMGGIH